MPDLLNNAALVAIAIFILKESWDWIKGSARKHIKALENNTIAVIRLEERLKILNEKIDKIPKLEKDINEAHSKIRHLNERVTQGQHPLEHPVIG